MAATPDVSVAARKIGRWSPGDLVYIRALTYDAGWQSVHRHWRSRACGSAVMWQDERGRIPKHPGFECESNSMESRGCA